METNNQDNPYQSSQNPGMVKRTNGLAVAGLIFGILSVTLGCLCFPPLFSIPGLVMSLIAKKNIRHSGEDDAGMATAGLVMSIISLSLTILLLALYVILIIAGVASGNLKDFQ